MSRAAVPVLTGFSSPSMRRWRRGAVALVALLGLACGSSSKHKAIGGITAEGGVSPAAQASGPRIAFIMKTLTNPFFMEMEKGARRAQQDTQVQLAVRTSTQETSVEQQIQLVEDEIRGGAKAIVIAPIDSMRLVPVLKKAQDAGLKVVNIDNRLSPETMAATGMTPVPFISVDNEKGAYKAAKFAADHAHGPTEAAIIEGIRTADNAELRKRGAERAFRANPAIRLVASETAHWQITEAYQVTKRLLKAHPRLGLVFCANDMMAFGAIKCLQESGRKDVLVAGFDGLEEAKPAIKAGQMLVSVDQQPAQQGYLGVLTALKLIRKESVEMQVEVDTLLVTADTLK